MQDGILRLPPELRELSGMTLVDGDTLACVQDELGAVFYVSLMGQAPVRKFSFGKRGDYEGIASTGDGFWVLRSDGQLLWLTMEAAALTVRKTYKLPIDGEFEGLCLDEPGQRLLILPKGPVDGKRREKARRRIYAFDLAKLKVVKKAVLTLKVEKLEEQAEDKGLAAPDRISKKGNRRVELHLHGSEILALPGGDLLLLSPKDRLLLRVDRDGDLVATRELDAALLPQPESMALLPDGQLLIGSEGHDQAATIVRMPMLKAP